VRRHVDVGDLLEAPLVVDDLDAVQVERDAVVGGGEELRLRDLPVGRELEEAVVEAARRDRR
jgi:hypothetical protein